jgi:cation diffusion facilitator family transporter
MKDHEYKSGVHVTVIGLFINLFLFGVKLAGGVWGHSHALVADAIHSASDFFTDLLALIGLKYLRKKKDKEHHYGHGKVETLSAVLLGIILAGIGVIIADNAVLNIYHHRGLFPGKVAIFIALLSIVLKEVLFRFTRHIGEKIKSSVLLGNAWHHRSDAFSSVAVLIGVGGAYIHPEWHILDAYAAIVVSVFIIWVGGQIVWKGTRDIIDSAPAAHILDRIEATAMSAPGVIRFSQLRARYSGNKIIVDFNIAVDPDITVRSGHKIATEVEGRILTEIPEVMDVLVHVEPTESD